MRHIILYLSLVLFSTHIVAADKVYKKVNPDGTVEFTDQPSSDAEEVPVSEVPTIKIKPAPPIPTTRFDLQQKEKPQVFSYKQVVITSPANDETIRDNAGNITIQGSVSPALRQELGHQLRWTMDGEVLEQQGLILRLTNVDRGTHTVQLEVIDGEGEVLASSQPVTFHLRRVFISTPANPAPNFPAPNFPVPKKKAPPTP